MTTPKLSMPELSVGQASKEITHNQSLSIMDQLIQAVIVDKDLTAPPGSPVDGDAYIVAPSATGAWAGKEKQIAYWRASSGIWFFVQPKNGWSVWVSDETARYNYRSNAWAVDPSYIQCFAVACSDETTAITAGVAKITFRFPYNFALTTVKASLNSAQASGSIVTVDINKNGASMLSTKLTIDNSERSSLTAATAHVLSSSSIANDDEITVDVDQVGDGTAQGLKVYLIGIPS